jgi:hypothetical protein
MPWEGLERTEVEEDAAGPAAEGAKEGVTMEVGMLAELATAFSLFLASQTVQTLQEDGG